MDVTTLAIVSGILAVVFAAASIYFIVRMLKKESMNYLAPVIVLLISEGGSLILFFLSIFRLLNLG